MNPQDENLPQLTLWVSLSDQCSQLVTRSEALLSERCPEVSRRPRRCQDTYDSRACLLQRNLRLIFWPGSVEFEASPSFLFRHDIHCPGVHGNAVSVTSSGGGHDGLAKRPIALLGMQPTCTQVLHCFLARPHVSYPRSPTPRISREQRRLAVVSRAHAVRELDAVVRRHFVVSSSRRRDSIAGQG